MSVMRLVGKGTVLVSALLMSVWAAASTLGEVELLIESGATGLAMEVINQAQPALENNPEHWLEWENQRISLYRQTRDWDGMIARLRTLPQWVPDDFRSRARELIARAQLEKKDTRAALQTLRELIWDGPLNEDDLAWEQSLPVWRQLVIQAYLIEENIVDAELAMLRFQQDYPNPKGDWKRARATVLIRAGRPEDAEILMQDDSHMQSRTIYYLARLYGEKAAPKSIWEHTRKLARNGKFSDATRRQFWLIASRAARETGDYISAIRAMQQALSLLDENETLSQREKLLFSIDGEDLWILYQDYGRVLGNKLQLLTGNDESWFAKASNLVDKRPLQAMALFAAMANDTDRQRTRVLAYRFFANLLMREKQGLSLVKKLYLSRAGLQRQDRAAFIPEALRHKLIDDALSRSDIKTASRLIQTVNEPPEGTDVIFWNMRRARIMILAGQVDEGVTALDTLLRETDSLHSDQIDRLIQVLFDLQTVGRHEAAIDLFRKIPLEGQSGRLRREILYWIADSYKAQKQYQQAARHYLLSAGLLDSKAMDPWAQTARYHAAEALAQAGDYEDAGRIYEALLKITKEPGRIVVLKNKIQQIWLQSNQGARTVDNSS